MLNKVQLIGFTGKTPDIRSTQSGKKVASFSLATNETYKNQNGEKQVNTEWHNIVIWGKLADVVEQYVGQGDKLYIEGKISTRKWEDKEGKTRYTTEIIANTMLMLGSSGDSNANSTRNDNNSTSTSNQVDDLPPEEDDLPF